VNQSNRQLWAHLALFGVSLFYGFNYFIAKDVFAGIPPLGMVAIRTTSAILFFGLISRLWIREKIKNRQDYGRLLLCGILGASLNQVFFFSGLSRTFEVNASVLMTTTPVFVFLAGFVLRTEKITLWKIAGLLLAFAGAALLTLGGRKLEFSRQTLTGDLMIVFNALSYGVYLVIARPLMLRYHALTVVFWVFVFGGLINIPLGISDLLSIQAHQLSGEVLWGAAYIVVFATFLAYGFNALGLQRIHSTAVGVYIYLQPVIVAVLSLFWRSDSMDLEKLIYMLLVLLGVFLVSLRK
jgi:drug/metabolite transporter (DMT)-like permease